MLDTVTLASIDRQRHSIASDDVIRAVAFAARAGHSTQTCSRFVAALSMAGAIGDESRWRDVLRHVFELEIEARGGV